jgi:primosomal protein N' (replication factor Y)
MSTPQRHPAEGTPKLWVESGEDHTGLVAEVAIIAPVEHTYSYAVPEKLAASLQLGQRVEVPLGKRGRPVEGFVVGLDEREWQDTLRPIARPIDDASYLSAELIELGRRVAEHYACPLGRTLKAMTPDAVRQGRGLTTVRLLELAISPEEWNAQPRLSKARRSILRELEQAGGPVPADELAEHAGVSKPLLRQLVKDGLLKQTEQRVVADFVEMPSTAEEPDYELNAEQQAALDHIRGRIDEAEFAVTLLFGVSGSGKTEVYVHAMRHVLARGRQAILLVPEIVLTTQLVQRLARRFPRVAVQHSGLTEGQRSIIWRQIASGEKQVVVGTRSAVFAPCPSLGLICVDEEQEPSYKNLQAPRFHVRDVAIMRAHHLGIPVVLGSATPSLETWHNCQVRSHYTRVDLPHRVANRPLPKVHVVDMGTEQGEVGRPVLLSRLLQEELAGTLAREEQAIILMNRRGYANRLYCPQCGMRIECPNCSASLVTHRTTGKVLCHYCHTWTPIPQRCPVLGCGGELAVMGAGTERVEEVLGKCFPGARICRADSDMIRHRSQYQQVVDDFEARRIDILLGTQMIAKGLDFPFVSFVGVLNADGGMMSLDFRGQERLFQLVTQVAGRAGRADRPGTVVVQAEDPTRPALREAIHHDFEAFATRALGARERTGLPPYRRLVRFVVSAARDEHARGQADELAQRMRTAINELATEGLDVWGPTPAPLRRLRNKYRWELLLRSVDASRLHRLMTALRAAKALRVKGASLMVDVDPVSLL